MTDTHHRTPIDRDRFGIVGVPLLIAVGAFTGANLRYVLGLQFPGLVGTFVANILGSIALGVLLSEGSFGGRLSRETRLLLGTGLLSSFTTYSTFALDVVTAAPAMAIGYVLATYTLGFAGVFVGQATARRLMGDEA